MVLARLRCLCDPLRRALPAAQLVRGYIPVILRMHHFTGLIFSPSE